MTLQTWLAFVLVWAALVAFPGPNMAYVVAIASRRGARAGAAAGLGHAFASLCYIVLVGLGLIAFVAASVEVFEVLRWIGVGYLVWLGVRAWRASTDPTPPPPLEARAAGGIFARAALISLTNPKSALSYVMVYPPFMAVGGDPATQLLVLGTTSVALSFAIYACFGLAAGRLGRLVRTRRHALIRNRAFAGVFFGAGALLAIAQRR